MSIVVTVLHIAVCVFLMLTVLLQAGKGGGMGSTFGGGSSSGTVFGGSGAGNFLGRLTAGAAVVFMLTSITLAYVASATGTDSLKTYSTSSKKLAEEEQTTHTEVLDSFGTKTEDGETTEAIEAKEDNVLDAPNADDAASATEPAVDKKTETPAPAANEPTKDKKAPAQVNKKDAVKNNAKDAVKKTETTQEVETPVAEKSPTDSLIKAAVESEPTFKKAAENLDPAKVTPAVPDAE